MSILGQKLIHFWRAPARAHGHSRIPIELQRFVVPSLAATTRDQATNRHYGRRPRRSRRRCCRTHAPCDWYHDWRRQPCWPAGGRRWQGLEPDWHERGACIRGTCGGIICARTVVVWAVAVGLVRMRLADTYTLLVVRCRTTRLCAWSWLQKPACPGSRVQLLLFAHSLRAPSRLCILACVVWLLPAVHLSRSWVPCVRMELLLKCAVRPLEIASVRWLGHTCMGAWSKVHVSCVADMGTYKEFLELANGKYSSLFV